MEYFSSFPSIASPSACHAEYTSQTLHAVLFSLPISHACLGHIVSFPDFWTLFSSRIPERSFSNKLNQACAEGSLQQLPIELSILSKLHAHLHSPAGPPPPLPYPHHSPATLACPVVHETPQIFSDVRLFVPVGLCLYALAPIFGDLG